MLGDLQHEAAVYQHLLTEQGVSVPRCVASGYILDSTLYFVATELLGPTLDSAARASLPVLDRSALKALERVHARGILHKWGPVLGGAWWPPCIQLPCRAQASSSSDIMTAS